eukprot:TRINITY_DN27385_c0_g1_i1.p1 TRINITY_DN27385_c0_g1~~TRINITY_DN27385_c0_g1_i1.p1  ORF type:complete len:290 (+),score=14.59 TRINITY_DN27385_c0_g1_i1:126-995(+)
MRRCWIAIWLAFCKPDASGLRRYDKVAFDEAKNGSAVDTTNLTNSTAGLVQQLLPASELGSERHDVSGAANPEMHHVPFGAVVFLHAVAAYILMRVIASECSSVRCDKRASTDLFAYMIINSVQWFAYGSYNVWVIGQPRYIVLCSANCFGLAAGAFHVDLHCSAFWSALGVVQRWLVALTIVQVVAPLIFRFHAWHTRLFMCFISTCCSYSTISGTVSWVQAASYTKSATNAVLPLAVAFCLSTAVWILTLRTSEDALIVVPNSCCALISLLLLGGYYLRTAKSERVS